MSTLRTHNRESTYNQHTDPAYLELGKEVFSEQSVEPDPLCLLRLQQVTGDVELVQQQQPADPVHHHTDLTGGWRITLSACDGCWSEMLCALPIDCQHTDLMASIERLQTYILRHAVDKRFKEDITSV